MAKVEIYGFQLKQARKEISGFYAYASLYRRSSLTAKIDAIENSNPDRLALILAVQSQIDSLIYEAGHPELYEKGTHRTGDTFELVQAGERCKSYLAVFTRRFSQELFTLASFPAHLVKAAPSLSVLPIVVTMDSVFRDALEKEITIDEALDSASLALSKFKGTVEEELAVAAIATEVEVMRIYRELDASF